MRLAVEASIGERRWDTLWVGWIGDHGNGVDGVLYWYGYLFACTCFSIEDHCTHFFIEMGIPCC